MSLKGAKLSSLAIVLLASLALAACGGAPAAQATPTSDVLPPVTAETFSVLAEGQVVPAQSATLSFQTAGVVEAILVEEGQSVKTGEPIARLTGSEKFRSQLTAAELELIQAEQALETLNKTAPLAKAQAELVLAKAQVELEDAKEDREKLQFRRASDNTIDQIRADYILAEDLVDQVEEQFDGVADRAEDDPIRAAALSQLAAARKARDRALYNLNYALGLPEPEDVAEAEARLQVAQQSVDDAQRTLDKFVGDGPNTDDLALAEARVANAKAAVAAAEAALSDLELTAPFDGTVVANNLKEGEYVTPGVTAAQLGNLSEWKVETTDLTELNVVDIEAGAPVRVTFDAITDLELTGTVERIKPLGENRQGDITYTILIKLDDQDPRLKWNMTAFVTFEQ
ncbi:MAG: HlyD family efflux transporter periplasmic adaptor subunit [Chloroflexi bacterium]|nr:HlyD family efflux transporter periplasmic adaptor subunit [Chloroflexota bacterium]